MRETEDFKKVRSDKSLNYDTNFNKRPLYTKLILSKDHRILQCGTLPIFGQATEFRSTRRKNLMQIHILQAMEQAAREIANAQKYFSFHE